MKYNQIPFPLVKLPADVQFLLSLIKEELKSRRLFQALHKAGLYDCQFQPHLDSLILNSLGIDDGTDEMFTLYDDILEKRSRKIDTDNDSMMKQSLKVYMELMEIKKKYNKGLNQSEE